MQENQHNLKTGSILQNYTIIRVLGEGGFGITYLAKDNELGLEVVIKEYFPNEFAMRSSDSTITAKSKSKGDFTKGMQRFKEEAQTLARFNHPSIVKILGYFEANDTAYFVMEYEEGIDLSQYLKQKGTLLKQEEILSIIMPILEGLKEVHEHNYLHRDIKPGNILLRSNNSPVLIDFGASKLAIGEASKSITSMLTEGYAPLEQYSTDIKQQGAFTDIYAIAAVVYKIITGNVPPSAQTRSYQLLQDDNDPYVPLLSLSLSGYDVSFLKAIDRALSMKAKDRPQNIQEFQENIAGKFIQKEKKADVNDIKKKNSNETKKSNSRLMITLGVMIVIAGGVLGYLLLNKQNALEVPKVTQKQPVEEVKKENEETGNERKEAGKIVEEVMKKVQEEKEVIPVPKTVIPKVPVWDAYKAEQIIYDKLRNYGGIRTYGFDRVADQYPSIGLEHKIIGFYELPYKAGKHMLAITSSSPEKNYDCHVCALKLSFFEFAIENGEWIVKTSYINTLQFGSWGEAPKKEKISVVALKQNKFGLNFDSSYSTQGYGEDMKDIYLLDNGTVKKIFSEIIASNDGGTGNDTMDWEATMSFDKSGTPFYDIVLHKTGMEDKKLIDEKVVYKFNGTKYVKTETLRKEKQDLKHKVSISNKYVFTSEGIERIASIGTSLKSVKIPNELQQRENISKEFAEGNYYEISTVLLLEENNILVEIREWDNVIDEILINSDKFETKNGAKVGMSLNRLLKLYPNAKLVHTAIEDCFQSWFVMVGNNIQFNIDKNNYIGNEDKCTNIDNVPMSDMKKNTKVKSIRIYRDSYNTTGNTVPNDLQTSQQISNSNMSTYPYVCYETKTYLSDGKSKYANCVRINTACSTLGKNHFGKYPNDLKAHEAFSRCIRSSVEE